MQKRHWIVAGALALGLGLLTVLASPSGAQGVAPAAADPRGAEVKPGEYWIGVEVQYPLPEAVRAQLSIPKDEGVLVQEVVPSSPADGKLKQYDILIKAADKPLKSVSDLLAAVNAAKDGKLAMEVLRGGKAVKVEVTPTKRPAAVPPTVDVWVAPDLRYKGLMEALKLSGPVLRYHTMAPGWILRPGTPHQPPLPGNLTISVTKQGDQPAKIVVKRDDQKWEVTENELDKLPNDVRPHVERMLGFGMGWPAADLFQQARKLEIFPHVGPKGEALSVLPHAGPKAMPIPNAAKQIDQMRQQVEQLRKALDELRAQLEPPKPGPSK
jgi:hypothetical protein